MLGSSKGVGSSKGGLQSCPLRQRDVLHLWQVGCNNEAHTMFGKRGSAAQPGCPEGALADIAAYALSFDFESLSNHYLTVQRSLVKARQGSPPDTRSALLCLRL